MSDFLYRCAPTETAPTSQAAASELMGRLMGMLLRGGYPGGSVTGVDLIVIADDSRKTFMFRVPAGSPAIPTAMEAQQLAWQWILDARIEPPNLAAGEMVTAAYLALVGWAIGHYLPVGVADAVREALAAAGVKVPGSVAGGLVGILGAGMDQLNAREGIRVAIAVLQELEKAMADGKIEVNEILPLVSAAFQELTDGDDPAPAKP